MIQPTTLRSKPSRAQVYGVVDEGSTEYLKKGSRGLYRSI